MISGYKSIKTLIAKVYRDLAITDESRWVSMIEWAGEALQLIGAYPQYETKTVDLTITGNKVALPCDFYKPIQISFKGVPLFSSTGSFDGTVPCDDCGSNLVTDHAFTYTINDSYIFTNFKSGEICLSYLAIPVDDEGFPLVPDDVTYDEALMYYIIKKLYFPKFLSGEMAPNMYDKLENDWNYKCMQARGSANMPTLDQMESLFRQWVRLIPDVTRHNDFFRNLNQRENIYLGKR